MRGRKRDVIRKVEWKSHIPEALALEVDLLLLDPTTGKVKHGARSSLVTTLVQNWLDAQRRELITP